MKRNQVTLAVLLAALSLVAAPSAGAISVSQVQAIKRVVAEVAPAEIAAQAADLVSQASAVDRKDVALTTVREVVSKKPATVVAVVGAIAKAAPEVSVAVAEEAAKLVPDESAAIAKAAASSAPAHAQKIAAAVAKAVPASATMVARSVAVVVPDQVVHVSEAVVKSVPAVASEIASDPIMKRLTQRSASSPVEIGIITTRPGTIRGTPPPILPPGEEEPEPGIDYARPH
jgi:hypothetical protein